MTHKGTNVDVKSLARLAFNTYLRTGRRLVIERKFNPYHDPEDGRFTFAPGGTSTARHAFGSAGGGKPPTPAPRPAAKPTSASQPTSKQPTGLLNVKHEEAPGQGPSTISSGKDDPGKISYGSYQINQRMVAIFVTSVPAQRWADKFKGLKPGSSAFNAQWKAIAKKEPDIFKAAQAEFVRQANYYPAVASVKRTTSYDLGNAHMAVREVTFSVATQHGWKGIREILTDAIKRTDQRLKRTDPNYQRTLINNIYDRRIEYMKNNQNKAKAKGHPNYARTFNNDIVNRYPKERADALRMLDGH